MKKIALHWWIIIGMILGVLVAVIAIFYGQVNLIESYLAPFGRIFMSALKLIAIPMVLFSIVAGVGSMKDIGSLGRMGAKTLGTYVVTTVLAASVGLLVVNIIQPGTYGDELMRKKNRLSYELWAESTSTPIKDDFRISETAEMQPYMKEAEAINMVNAQNEKFQKGIKNAANTKDAGPLQMLEDIVPENLIDAFSKKNEGQMLQVIFFALFFGLISLKIPGDKSKIVHDFFDAMNEVFVKMVNVVMMAAPFFVFCLMASAVVNLASNGSEVLGLLQSLMVYSLVVVFGLVIMLILYPLFIHLFVKELSFKKFVQGIKEAQIMAFSTSSSVATLPVTMKSVHKLGVREKVANFVLPIGATVNMDGTCLYQAVAVVFLAQFHMVDLTLMDQLMIVLTATLGSIGAAAVPSAGLVFLILILESVGLPPFWIAIIFPVDRILDMCRTVVNVTGDSMVSTLIASSENELDVQAQ